MEEVIAPIFRNESNLSKFPHCLSQGKLLLLCFVEMNILDIKTHAQELNVAVSQVKGYIRGKTLLPFPEVWNLIKSFFPL